MQKYSKIKFFLVSSILLATFLVVTFIVPPKSNLQSITQIHVTKAPVLSMLPKEAQASLVNLPEPKNLIELPILMYHHVGDAPPGSDGTRRDLTVNTKDFQKQVEWLKQSGYESVTLAQLEQRAQGNFTLPKKPIIFTFDDGYSDVFENAVPILLQNGYTGSFAIITQFAGLTNGTNVYATWDEITAAQKQGMEIVSHTQNHFDGTSLKYSSDYIYQNLSGARQDLLAHGIQTNILIYPYGHYNFNYIELAQKAGYKLGITVRFGNKFDPSSLMQIPRVRVHGSEDLQRFADALLGRLAPKVGPVLPDSQVK